MNIFYYYMNPCEIAFNNWAKNRESHPSDNLRFFTFVNTVCNYYKTEGNKWEDKGYFEYKCLNRGISREEINYYFNMLETIIKYKIIYKHASSIPKRKKPEKINNHCQNQYFQIGFYDDTFLKLEISKNDFLKNGVGKKKFFKLSTSIKHKN